MGGRPRIPTAHPARGRRRPRPEREKSRGAAAIEFALLLPILILFIFGIIEFGRGYNAKITLTHAAREAVRVYSLDTGDPTAVAQAASPGLNVSVSTSGGPCSSAANAGQPVSVTVSHDLSYTIPFFGTGTFALAETATMRCGG